ncbi:VanZ family protein [Saccharothrix longispora]|uniref:VanZ family protein n=1 Tax=Saccharothrix longispora TaxID=33920 RepID=UPI0028FD2740|nr:VanZ family protein [Saccharothrix longispora]MBY8850040.1 VanZ family protein [Saccharothrix sp. MB29]MDU0287984.1 VanZ family protein [Saccharothrix longispora]
MSVRASEAVIAVVLFALLLPVAVLPWVHRQYRLHGRLRGWSAFVAAAGAFYGCGLVAFTLFPLPVVTPGFCDGRPLRAYWQLRPLASLDDIAGVGYAPTSPQFLQVALNVALFVPLGFLLAHRFRRGPVTAAAIGFAVSLGVETVQGTAVFGLYPCPYRIADVDDLITNTAGAVLGWVLARTAGRSLPPAVPEPVADTGPPGLPRRAAAFLGDLLTLALLQVGARLVLVLAEGGAPGVWADRAVGVLVPLVSVLAVPLLRADRATPGQVAFHLALVDARIGGRAPARAAVLRFLVWWLPVLLLLQAGHGGHVVLAAGLVGLAARARADRRSPLGLLSGTRTTTRAAGAGAVRTAADR